GAGVGRKPKDIGVSVDELIRRYQSGETWAEIAAASTLPGGINARDSPSESPQPRPVAGETSHIVMLAVNTGAKARPGSIRPPFDRPDRSAFGGALAKPDDDTSALSGRPIDRSDANCPARDRLRREIDLLPARDRVDDPELLGGRDEGRLSPAVEGDPDSPARRFHDRLEGAAMIVEHDVIDRHRAPRP